MKKVIVLLLMTLPMVANAQRVDKPGEAYDVFCQIMCYTKTNSKKMAKVTWGDNKFVEYLCDRDGQKIEFISQVSMLNYMSKIGWIYIEKTDESTYIFKKTVKDDKEAKEYIWLESDFKK